MIAEQAWWPVLVMLAAAVLATDASAGLDTATDGPAPAEPSKPEPVVRVFGAEDGYHTEVISQASGTLSGEDQRQISLLMAQVFQHIDEARRAIEVEDLDQTRQEVAKGQQESAAIRALLLRTRVQTRTLAPDGAVLYEDEREVQDSRIPLFEGMLHARTLAPILAAKREAAVDVSGVRLVESEPVSTEVLVDLDLVETQMGKAAKFLDENRGVLASRSLAEAQVRGVELRFRREDVPLAEARDALWLVKRALEENNLALARANLNLTRQRLHSYRDALPPDQRQDVDQMLQEVEQLQADIRPPERAPSRVERTRQGNTVLRWWEKIHEWFRGF